MSMRKQFIPCDTICPDAAEAFALNQCPWAAVIELCEGGCMAFESRYDYIAWEGQK